MRGSKVHPVGVGILSALHWYGQRSATAFGIVTLGRRLCLATRKPVPAQSAWIHHSRGLRMRPRSAESPTTAVQSSRLLKCLYSSSFITAFSNRNRTLRPDPSWSALRKSVLLSKSWPVLPFLPGAFLPRMVLKSGHGGPAVKIISASLLGSIWSKRSSAD